MAESTSVMFGVRSEGLGVAHPKLQPLEPFSFYRPDPVLLMVKGQNWDIILPPCWHRESSTLCHSTCWREKIFPSQSWLHGEHE
ncbi:hypothetical protein VNO77_03471 [Canavalia gladiata]|uniref:Uncharacterized protein n=1 Tax=Canavalia gladiata TaxID=3824 RepID=A0AAN9RC98_CANGL